MVETGIRADETISRNSIVIDGSLNIGQKPVQPLRG
jgi:hypothetical protein